MTRQELISMTGTLVRVFVAAVLAQFIAGGADVFAVDGEGLRTIISSGISAVAVTAFNWLNSGDDRYGRVK